MTDNTATGASNLAADKRALLAYLLEEKGIVMRRPLRIDRRTQSDDLPLSFAQQRLWFLDQLSPGSPVYNIPRAVHLAGQLDVAALGRSLMEVVRRHESLRTTFGTAQGYPIQIIAPPDSAERNMCLPVVDLQHMPAAMREATVQSLANAEGLRPFDLQRGPLLRAGLLRLSEAEHVLLFTMHHIISDGWSMGILIRELAALYTAFLAGRLSPLPELPIQYADYAIWQRAYLQGEDEHANRGHGDTETRRHGDTEQGASDSPSLIPRPLSPIQAQLAYWKAQLGGSLPMLELPSDRPRPPVPSLRGLAQTFVLPMSLTADLTALSQREDATLFMTLLTAFEILLYRYSGQDDIVIGSPIAGRNRAETEHLIGFFINTLVLRTDLSGNPSVRELLARTRAVALGAFDHQDVPFEKLVEELHPERHHSRTPLFQVTFVLQNAPMAAPELPGLSLQLLTVATQTAKFDLTLSLEETSQGLSGLWEYSCDLFDAMTIARLSGHFQTLLTGIVADPAARIAALPLLTMVERQQLIVAWNATTSMYPRDLGIHDLFTAQATRTPDVIAMVFDRGQLTYRELNARANRLAHHLRALGVGREDRVGIFMERSAEFVVGLLGVLKAGATYVPLDLAYPAERLQYMLEDSGAGVLITASLQDTQTRGQADKEIDQLRVSVSPDLLVSRTVVDLRADWPLIARQRSANPPSGATATNAAYIMYTSGSTGAPKGICIPHRAISRLLCNTDYIQLDLDDRIAQVSNTAFDAATFEIWGALLHGACLVGFPRAITLSTHAFAVRLRTERITTMFITTALFNQFAHEAPTAFQPLRQLLFGGEAVDPHWVDEILRHDPPRRLLHVYGPTESTTFTTWHLVALGAAAAPTIPIGRPIANTGVYVLDRALQPVPVGVPGELYIGGDGLARGYHNRPDLTAERFVPNPFAEVSGAGYRVSEDKLPDTRYPTPATRLYKTGDLVRYRPGGIVEFLGRIDQQVKIRGFRVEPGEVEALLSRHPAIHEAVVVARSRDAGHLQLIAYVVPDPTQPPTVSDLRRFLQSALPEYMIPSAFTFLGALPLTPNGKVDRVALPTPDPARPTLEKAFIAPRTPLEQMLGAMWQDLLGIETIGVHDNFFELGGNSIQAAIFINKLQEKLGEMMYVVALFDASTIADLAVYLTKQYPNALAKIFGTASLRSVGAAQDAAVQELSATVNASIVEQVRQMIGSVPLRPRDDHTPSTQNPPAIFILSPPRSGSTLLRIILAGHPQLFAPPELELLSFNTLVERKAAFSDKNRFGLEGTVRAIMQIKGCDAAAAERIMAECEAQQLTVQAFYRLLQAWIGDKTLVDKTPSYCFHREILDRAEADFAQARYIHLVRHPYGMIRSFEEARVDQMFLRREHSFSTRTLAELIWLISHQNIGEFLGSVPAQRQHRVTFEDLVTQPRATLERICDFLGLEFHPDMLEPYKDQQQRMTDGIHGLSKMLGDRKFHEHRAINAAAGERWKQHYTHNFLGDITWWMAEALGYADTLSHDTHLPPAPTALTPIQRLPRDGSTALPLSFAQQRLWFLDQLQPNSLAYNIPAVVRMVGALNIAALQQSLDELVRRHETLRTTFLTVDDRPFQVIAPVKTLRAALLPLPVVDLQAVFAVERETTAQHLAFAEALRPFDLARGPLLRATVLRLGDHDHVLLLMMHHIVSDGWSMGILVREVAAFYDARTGGKPALLPELPIQYADFTYWQREWLQGAVLETQLAYWRRQLAGASEILALPTDRPRPAVQSFRGAQRAITLSPALTEALTMLSRREGVSLFMVLLAAFQTLLYRYTSQADIVVGSPIAGRNRAELESLIGFFVNTLVLRTTFAGSPSFPELLRQVRRVTLGAYAHQDLPFEKLVEELQPTRDLSHAPLFQVMFGLHNMPAAPLDLPNLSLGLLEVATGTVKFDLTLFMVETEQGLAGSLQYATDLFDATTIARLGSHYQTLLAGLVADPERRVADVALMTDAERQQIVVDWNATETVFPQAVCLHTLFEAQVARTPDALAVVLDSSGVREQGSGVSPEHVTYRELDQRANQLAWYLRVLGVGPDALVGVCLERSLGLAVALLGVLKAGGGYVPLDPSYPAARLAFMLEDAQVAVLITTSIYDLRLTIDDLDASQIPIVNRKSKIVNLHADWPTITRQPARAPVTGVSAANLAYVIYTSGSTGQPKGAMNIHRGICNRLLWMQAVYQLTSADHVLQKTPISFDVSVWELFWPLLAGAVLVMARPGLQHDSAGLVRLICEQHVTTLHFVPSILRVFLQEPGLAACTSLRRVISSGEALASDVQTLFFMGLGAELYNLYGPTEAAVDVTYWACQPDRTHQLVPIGRPIANTQIYVLDAQLQSVPIGVPGELYIGGVQLARGYLNRPDLTAARFVPNPSAKVSGIGSQVSEEAAPNTRHPAPGTRLYRTGDLARYLPDGAIEFLGRLDQQVKVRGFRIELGEIEALLRQHPAACDTTVAVREDVPGDRRLVAYVVPAETLNAERRTIHGPEWSSSAFSVQRSALGVELRAFLMERLPDYMVPSAFMLLDALPLTPSGKLDRQALPAPDPARPALATAFVAPQTPDEELLAQIWAAVIGRTSIGVHDNFFELGGHSLLATQVISRVREVFQVELPLRIIFEAPTVAALAEQIATARRAGLPLAVPPLRPVPRKGLLPLSFAQQRLWFLDQFAPRNPFYNMPMSVQLSGLLDVVALKHSLAAIVARHEILRTTFAAVDGQPAQVIAPALALPLPLLDLRALPADARAACADAYADAEARQPFDLARGPLLRTVLLRLDIHDHVLLLTMHHIIKDGWSMGVIMREFAALYPACRAGQPAPLPPLPIQYADYAVWQREWLQGAALAEQLAYWREHLADHPMIELPIDRPRPPLQSFHGAQHPLVLPGALTAALKVLSQQTGSTLFMVLLAAVHVLLGRYSGQSRVVVGTPIANRTQAATEPLIGFFVNTLALCSDLSGNPTFREVLRQVRASSLGAYAHQDLPFEKLVDELRLERDLSRHPLFQVMFVLQNAPLPDIALPDLTLRTSALDNRTTRLDLTLSLGETADGLRGLLVYNTDIFDATTIMRLARHFQRLIEGCVAEPDQRIAAIPLLAEAERQQLLVEWNDTATGIGGQASGVRSRASDSWSVHEVFAAQAKRTPDVVALVFDFRDKETGRQGDRETPGRTTNDGSVFSVQRSAFSVQYLTYAELDRRANQLAHHLQSLGVGLEVVVALCVERSLELVVGLLGILKSAGTYVPLDPTYPLERLSFMLEDSRASILLTQERLAGDLPAHGALTIYLDSEWEAIDQQLVEPPNCIVHAENLAYVIYTSGSTGTPKGVQVPHRGLGNLAAAQIAAFGVRPDSRVLQFASFCFDASVSELWMALLTSATLCLGPQDLVLAGPALTQLIQQQEITTLTLPPSVLATLPELELPTLRTLIIAGEAGSTELVTRWAGGRALLNGYGLTETTVCATMARCADMGQPLLIGRPIANTHVYLLDAHLQPVPIGVPGELYVAGINLARGYLNRPDLTAERFVPNPFAEVSGTGYRVSEDKSPDTRYLTPDPSTRSQGDKEIQQSAICNLQSAISYRLYATGDLARFRPTGDIEFLGRVDAQVKIRGYRIELGEIEAALARHPDVREVVVVAREDVPGDKRLVAYVVPQDTNKQTSRQGDKEDSQLLVSVSPGLMSHAPSLASDLRGFLHEQLPEHMLPSAFVMLDALPLTPNGKIDRRALPAPEKGRPRLDMPYAAPQTALEHTIAGIWQELLEIKQVGRDDNFFDLGGHSLLLVQAHDRLRKALDRDIALVDMFKYPTVSTLAQFLHQQPDETPSLQHMFDRAAARRDSIGRRARLRDTHREGVDHEEPG